MGVRRIPERMPYKYVEVFNSKTKKYEIHYVPDFGKERNRLRKK